MKLLQQLHATDSLFRVCHSKQKCNHQFKGLVPGHDPCILCDLHCLPISHVMIDR